MAGLPRVLLVLVSLAVLANGIIPGLIFPPGMGGHKLLGGPLGPAGNPPLTGLFGSGSPRIGLGGGGPGGGLGSMLRSLGGKVPCVKFDAGPGGINGQGIIPGIVGASGSIKPLIGGSGSAGSSLLADLLGNGLPLSGGGHGIGHHATQGASGANGPASNVAESPAGTTDGRLGPAATSAGAGSGGARSNGDSSEEDENKKKNSSNGDGFSPGGSAGREKPAQRPVAGSSGSRNNRDSSEEKESSGGSTAKTKSPRRSGAEGGKGGSRSNAAGSEETESKKRDESNEDDRDSRENKKRKRKQKKSKRKSRLGRRVDEDSRRNKRSLMDEFSLMGTKGAHHAFDNVPDHVKVVYCGRHEVPNPGGIEDHFCHPDATWDTLLRMRPDCVCQQGFLRNSWGECISPAECDHCSDKHHLNMDYHLCESPCPIVCNQPIDENCPNTCFKECACRPGYIRAYPNGPCVSIKQCLPGCRGRNQIFSLCSSLCPPTCRKPVPKRCPNICAGEGCVCKPGYVVKKWEPLVCVRPENCPGRRKKCPGPNQRYSRCIRRCAPSCFRRRHRYCGHDCLGRGCVCKRGYVVLQRRPLVCVRRDECPARRKKCPERNQVYMYCKSKCPRTCEEPKPRKCVAACGGEGCACKPGYVIKQEDPLVCVRRYQCDLEDIGDKGAKGAMGTKGSMGAKGAIGEMGAMGAKGVKGARGVKGANSSSPYPPFPTWPYSQN